MKSALEIIVAVLSIIGSIYAFIKWIVPLFKPGNLLSEEIEEVQHADGSKHRKQKRIFK